MKYIVLDSSDYEKMAHLHDVYRLTQSLFMSMKQVSNTAQNILLQFYTKNVSTNHFLKQITLMISENKIEFVYFSEFFIKKY